MPSEMEANLIPNDLGFNTSLKKKGGFLSCTYTNQYKSYIHSSSGEKIIITDMPSGKRLHNYVKIHHVYPFLTGKPAISMAIFNTLR